MTFSDCAIACIGNEDLVREFNRLSGCHLSEPRMPFDAAIDCACGYDPDVEAFPAFLAFVHDYIWFPLIAQNK